MHEDDDNADDLIPSPTESLDEYMKKIVFAQSKRHECESDTETDFSLNASLSNSHDNLSKVCYLQVKLIL